MNTVLNRQQIAGSVDHNSGVFAAAPGVNINQGHSLIVDGYEQVLYDYLLREFPIGIVLNSLEASGPIHIYNEQKSMATNACSMDPKLGVGTTTPDYAKGTVAADASRDNWVNAVPRCYGSRIEYDYFALKAEQRYGTFEDLTIKDYNDMIVDYTKVTANDFWNGRSTGIADTASTYKFEYTGVLAQISSLAANVTAIADGTFIADAVQSKIAGLQARLDYKRYPTMLAMN